MVEKDIKGDEEKSVKKYAKMPVPETIMDVAAIFDKVQELVPNSILFASSLNSPLRTPFTLVASAPVSKRAELASSSIENKDDPEIQKRLGAEEDDIVDKDDVIIPMIAMMVDSLCRSYDLDRKKLLKVVDKLLEKANNSYQRYQTRAGK